MELQQIWHIIKPTKHTMKIHNLTIVVIEMRGANAGIRVLAKARIQLKWKCHIKQLSS